MEQKQIQGTIKNKTSDRKATFIASTSDVDRHKHVVNQAGWQLDNFNANGIIGYQHNVYGGGLCEKASPDDIIGKGHAYIQNNQLMVDVEFKPEGRSELADKIWNDVQDGFLKTVSVGFIEIGKGQFGRKDEKGNMVDTDVYFFEGQELLEVSIVNIPSNPKALRKHFRDSTATAIHSLVKAFNGQYSYSEIENFKVKDIVSLLKKDQLINNDKEINKDNVKPNPEEGLQKEIGEIREQVARLEKQLYYVKCEIAKR